MLILVRHGQTAVNAGGRLQGRIDQSLTELGRRQASTCAAAVGAPSRVIASPLLRAQETAAALAPSGVEVEVDDRWVELDYGEWDGVPLGEVPRAAWTRWRSDPAFAPPGGESLVTLTARVQTACEELALQAASEDVVVVSHVSPIKAAVAWALGVGPETSWRMFLGVAAVCRISVNANGPSLISFNETAHTAPLMTEIA